MHEAALGRSPPGPAVLQLGRLWAASHERAPSHGCSGHSGRKQPCPTQLKRASISQVSSAVSGSACSRGAVAVPGALHALELHVVVPAITPVDMAQPYPAGNAPAYILLLCVNCTGFVSRACVAGKGTTVQLSCKHLLQLLLQLASLNGLLNLLTAIAVLPP